MNDVDMHEALSIAVTAIKLQIEELKNIADDSFISRWTRASNMLIEFRDSLSPPPAHGATVMVTEPS